MRLEQLGEQPLRAEAHDACKACILRCRKRGRGANVSAVSSARSPSGSFETLQKPQNSTENSESVNTEGDNPRLAATLAC